MSLILSRISVVIVIGLLLMFTGCQKDSSYSRAARVGNEILIPEVRFENATLPEIAKFFENESKRLDPDGKGVNVVILSPRDFGYEEPGSQYRMTLLIKNVPLMSVGLYAASKFDQKVKFVGNDIIYMPARAKWENLKRRRGFKKK